MKIEFEIDPTDFQKALIEHMEIEQNATITEILKHQAERYLREQLAQRTDEMASLLARNHKIDAEIIDISLSMAQARRPIW